jgi:threonine dehydrogenase-like Zn-dependent dehydrogenase
MNSTYSANHVNTLAVLDLSSTKRVDTNALTTRRFGFDGIEEAIRLYNAADASLKSVIYPTKDLSQNYN